MHTTANPAARRLTLVRGAAALGLGVLVVGGSLAPGQAPTRREPAARLKLPQPIETPDTPIITRGLGPETAPSGPPRPTTPPASGWSSAPAATAARTTAPTMPTRAPLLPRPKAAVRPPVVASGPAAVRPGQERPSLLDRAWTGVKEFVNGPAVTTAPMAAYPAPGIVPHQPYTFTPPTAPRPTPAPANVYAGPPAYRWYGWGTTTPGANPYAPGGEHPRGSASWFSQTGATPGAFPVPVTGTSLALGASPPSYVMPAATRPRWPAVDRSMIPLTMPAVSVQPPVIQTYPGLPTVTPQPVVPAGTALPILTVPSGSPVPLSVAPVDSPAPSMDGPAWQRSETIPVSVPTPMPSTPISSPPASDTNWGPAKDAPPVARGQIPSGPEPVSLDGRIRSASSGWATVTEVKQVGPTKLVVKLAARNDIEARAAADEISRIPQLKPYAVLFEVQLASK